jgi:hypothetical protein
MVVDSLEKTRLGELGSIELSDQKGKWATYGVDA